MWIKDENGNYHNVRHIQRLVIRCDPGSQWKILAEYDDLESVYCLSVHASKENAERKLQYIISDIGCREVTLA